VRQDLANARMGQLVAPDGRTFSIRTARIERDEVEALIESGCPVVAYFPGGRLGRRRAGLASVIERRDAPGGGIKRPRHRRLTHLDGFSR
jgi:hypothetical protein